MKPFQKSRVALLEELMVLVNESLTKSHNYQSLGEKRYNRKMKRIRKALKEFIKETEAHYASDPSNRDQ